MADAAYFFGGVSPIGGAQRCKAVARMLTEEDDTLVSETLVFDNLAVFFTPINDVLIGRHMMTSPEYSDEFIPELREVCAHVGPCQDAEHAGYYMVFGDPEREFA